MDKDIKAIFKRLDDICSSSSSADIDNDNDNNDALFYDVLQVVV